MNKDIRIIFAGGGTGGHVFPAIYMAQYFKKYWGANCLFIGTNKGIESRKVPQSGFVLKKIWISGFHRRFDLRNLLFPIKLLVSMQQSKKEIREFQPTLVIGTGGYVSGPVLYQAAKMKIPTFIQEQNSYPGVTTRILASKVDHVFAAYSECLEYLKGIKSYSIIGNPVRNNLGHVDKVIARQFFGLRKNQNAILVFGGSQGSHNINKTIDALIEIGAFSGTQLIWQTGENEFEKYKNKYKNKAKNNIHILPFIDKMEYVYSISDFVICRAGAMAIAELVAVGLPAILVPLPGAAANHQYKNAKSLADAKAALLVEDNKNLQVNLGAAVQKMKSAKKLKYEMKTNLRQFYTADALKKIADKIQGILKEKE